MSTQYNTKENALQMGMLMAGRPDLYKKGDTFLTLYETLKNPDIKVIDDTINQFGHFHKDSIMIEFNNEKNKSVRIATTPFRGGFDLWLIEPKGGICTKV